MTGANDTPNTPQKRYAIIVCWHNNEEAKVSDRITRLLNEGYEPTLSGSNGTDYLHTYNWILFVKVG